MQQNDNIQATSQKKVAMHTLGCRLNFSETATIAQGFVERGYQIVPFGKEADVVFINTCTVTDGADSSCRNLIRKAYRSSPEGKIVVAGCYAQMEATKVKTMQGVDLVLGTSEKYRVFDFLEEENQNNVHIDKSNEFWGAATTTADSHTRAFLKIQDGCNYICSFCIIPFARGRSRTITIKDAVRQAEGLVEKGFKEIVLTGVNIGEYDRGGEKLSDLVKNVLKVEGLERLRLSSVEPNTFNRELLEVLASSSKSQNHFHVPLQSGCDKTLAKMKRKYSVEDYRRVIQMIQEYFPQAAFGADVIAGFPGETEGDFQATYDFMKEMPLTHFHVFPFSQRKNTVAAKMPDHIQAEVKKFRVHELIALGEQKLAQLAESRVGKVESVLFERCNEEGYFEGYTSQFVKLWLKSESNLKNRVETVNVCESRKEILLGEIS